MAPQLPSTVPSVTCWEPAPHGTWQADGPTRTHVDPSREELGPEGYELTITPGLLTLTAATPAGAAHGQRRLDQMLRQATSLPAGRVQDRPRYRERGLTLCASQIGLDPTWVTGLMEHMAHLGLNYLLLEAKIAVPTHPETATWHYYTAEQVDHLATRARELGIELVPEVNSPGHMGVWLENHPELQLRDVDGQRHPEMLDLSNPAAVRFYLDLVDAYRAAFPTTWFHMGADEYMIGTAHERFPELTSWAQRTYGPGATIDDAFTAFVNTVNDHVRASGGRLRMWNDGVMDTRAVRLDEDVVVEYWYAPGTPATELAARGMSLMNANEALYFSRSAQFYDVDCQGLWEGGWDPGAFPSSRLDPTDPAIRGAKVSVWPDSGLYETENEVAAHITDALALIAQLTWTGHHDALSWPDFAARARQAHDWPPARPAAALATRPVRLSAPDGRLLGLVDGQPHLVAPAQAGQEAQAATWWMDTTPEGYTRLANAATGRALALLRGDRHLDVVTQEGAPVDLAPLADTSASWDSPGARARGEARNTQKWALQAAAPAASAAPAGGAAAGGAPAGGGAGDPAPVVLRHALSGQALAADPAGRLVQLPAHAGALVWQVEELEGQPRLVAVPAALPQVAGGGEPATVHLHLSNPGPGPLTGLHLGAVLPEGWELEGPGLAGLLPTVLGPGQTAELSLGLLPVQAAGSAELAVTAHWEGGSATAVTTVTGAAGRTVRPEPVACSASQDGHPLASVGEEGTGTYWSTPVQPGGGWVTHWVDLRLDEPARVTALVYTPRPGTPPMRPRTAGSATGA